MFFGVQIEWLEAIAVIVGGDSISPPNTRSSALTERVTAITKGASVGSETLTP